MSAPHLRLGVNVDHVATIRNARGGRHPDPVRAAQIAIEAGADGITAHLREDRRHIRDDDIARLKADIAKPLNLEMAATEEMVAIALRHRPHAACIVPEKREAIWRRAADYSQSRVVGGMHYPNDLLGGKLAGTAIAVALHGRPEFTADLAAARRELRQYLQLP